MKGLKKLWNENRVMLVLSMIIVICIVIISIIVMKYFFGVTASNYGNRLDDISSFPITEEIKSSIELGFTSENLESVSVDVRGKIIYVIAKFNSKVSLEDAKNLSFQVYHDIDESYRNLYDFNVTVLQDKTEESGGYSLMGSKNVSSSDFKWSNNTPIEDGE